MQAGFYTIMAAQFFSSLADNALLVAAIQMLRDLESPAWMTPSLKQVFVISYVLLAPLVGAFADSMPKGRVMLITNGIKICGCAFMLFTLHPLMAYALVGLGAAAYSPAKYGILTELLPARQLVIANGWIEGATVASIILGRSRAGSWRSTFPRSIPASKLRRRRRSRSSWDAMPSPRYSTGTSPTPASIAAWRARIRCS
jgi:MFS family permease